MITTDNQRFHNGAEEYAAYLRTFEGRLRSDLTYANLEDFLSHFWERKSLCALDVGAGTGVAAVRLARLGIRVTALDSSEAMMDLAKRSAREAGVAENIVFRNGDAGQLASSFENASFDVILCHNVLEYVDEPGALLCTAARLLRNSSAVLSILVRNQAGEVLKAAVQGGDLATAANNLTAEWAQESLYGGRVRLFTPDALRAMLKAASLAMIEERGVRVLADYLPSQVSRDSEYDKVFELERKLGNRPGFAAIARYTHCFASGNPTTGSNV